MFTVPTVALQVDKELEPRTQTAGVLYHSLARGTQCKSRHTPLTPNIGDLNYTTDGLTSKDSVRLMQVAIVWLLFACDVCICVCVSVHPCVHLLCSLFG